MKAEATDSSLYRNLQSGSAVHPAASHSMDIGGFFLGVNSWGQKLTICLYIVSLLECVEQYFHSPTHTIVTCRGKSYLKRADRVRAVDHICLILEGDMF
jgi:hypothetical protein